MYFFLLTLCALDEIEQLKCKGYWRKRADERLSDPPPEVDQEPLV